MKIAPVLQRLVEFERVVNADPRIRNDAPAELRALLAVARAAKNHDHVWPADPSPCTICRALARLEKVSGRKP